MVAPMALPKPACNGDVANGVVRPTITKLYVSYDQVHHAVAQSLGQLQSAGWGTPDILLAISGGGLIPARILRSVLRSGSNNGGCAQIKVIGLELYDDMQEGRPRETGVLRKQWLQGELLVGKRILLVDEVDDSRMTLEYAAREVKADIAAQEAELAAQGRPVPETQLGIFVVHNKRRNKQGVLPADVQQFVAQEVDDCWIKYPWDAEGDIYEHTRRAHRFA